MGASSISLTDISFEGMVVHKSGQPYDLFLQHHFPNLQSLQLGSLIQTNIPHRTNTLITQFIHRHNGIQHLSLGRRRDNDMFFQFDETLLVPDSLSLLQSFEGFPENIAALARCEVSSLYQITTLSLFCQTTEDAFAEIQSMFESVRTPQHPPKKLCEVKHLRLHLDVQLDHQMPSDRTPLIHLRLMDQFADMCPLVTTLHGRLHPMSAVCRVSFHTIDDRLMQIGFRTRFRKCSGCMTTSRSFPFPCDRFYSSRLRSWTSSRPSPPNAASCSASSRAGRRIRN